MDSNNRLALLAAAGIIAGGLAYASDTEAKTEPQPSPAAQCSDSNFTVDCLVAILDQDLPSNAAQRDEVELRQSRWLRGAAGLFKNAQNQAVLHTPSVIRELTDVVKNNSVHPIVQADALDFMGAMATYESQQSGGNVPASSDYLNLNNQETRAALIAYATGNKPAALKLKALTTVCAVAASQPDVSNLLVDRALQSTNADERAVIMQYLTLDNTGVIDPLFGKIMTPGANGAAGDTIQAGAIRTLGEMYLAKVAQLNTQYANNQQQRDAAVEMYATLKGRLQAMLIGLLFNTGEGQAVRDQAAHTLVAIAPIDPTVQGALSATGYNNLLY